jgi:hypothetical protein
MRGTRRLVVVLLLALACLPAAASASASAVVPAGRFGVGDSIMLSAEDELAVHDVSIDAEVGRQFSTGLRLVRRLANNEKLPRNVIVHLGTNGYVQAEDCDRLVSSAPSRRIFLTTVRVPREWQDPNNQVVNDCAARYDRVFVIRWFMVSKDHPDWFATDSYHLNAAGQQAYADLIRGDVNQVLRSLRRG